MIKLTNFADYAVLLLVHMARQTLPSLGGKVDRVNAQDLSVQTTLPVPTVSKILNALAKANILVSQRGLKGGFYLAKDITDISVADIVEAIDGPIALTNCAEEGAVCCYDKFCSMKPKWQVINTAVRKALDGVKLIDIVDENDGSSLEKLLSIGG